MAALLAVFFAGDFLAAAGRALVFFAGRLVVFRGEAFFVEAALTARFAGALRLAVFFIAVFFTAVFFAAFFVVFVGIQNTSG